eukprot:6136173-Alexandrium_andersonii.AAC.1
MPALFFRWVLRVKGRARKQSRLPRDCRGGGCGESVASSLVRNVTLRESRLPPAPTEAERLPADANRSVGGPGARRNAPAAPGPST